MPARPAKFGRQEINPFYAIDPELLDFHQIRGCLKSNILLLAAKFYLESLVPAGPDINRKLNPKNPKSPLGAEYCYHMPSLRDSETS
jgi:hypothetical protein